MPGPDRRPPLRRSAAHIPHTPHEEHTARSLEYGRGWPWPSGRPAVVRRADRCVGRPGPVGWDGSSSGGTSARGRPGDNPTRTRTVELHAPSWSLMLRTRHTRHGRGSMGADVRLGGLRQFAADLRLRRPRRLEGCKKSPEELCRVLYEHPTCGNGRLVGPPRGSGTGRVPVVGLHAPHAPHAPHE